MEHCGYITKIKNLRKHSNADRLLVGECFDNTVVVDLNTKPEQIGLYIPTDMKLGKEFAEKNNLLRKKDDQGNEVGGYMDPVKRNVKAIRLRGERSDGLFMPLSSLKDFCNVEDLKVGDRITTLNGYVICEKYIPRTNRPRRNAQNTKKKSKTILFPLFKEHADTEQLDYNWGEIKKGDLCILTLKMHGTSQRTAYLPKENTGLRKLLRLPKKYDIVTGTRRVVLENIDNSTTGGYYKDDGFRKQWHNFFKGKLIKGEEVFYEVVGYTEKDKPIMGDGNNKKINDKEFVKMYGDTTRFSYGCENGECKAYVYRMTYTNEDGYVIEYPWDLVKARCEEMGIDTVPEFERFTFKTIKTALRKVVSHLDIADPIGKTHIAEGVVLRLNNRTNFKAFKKKGFYFKVLEGLIKDEADAPDIEEAQETLEENNV